MRKRKPVEEPVVETSKIELDLKRVRISSSPGEIR
jgi:hypothetical protein